MALPSPLPDDPRKWDGWKCHDSPDAYERLCLSFETRPSDELIEENCRQLLVWWQKKLPLRHQPSNPSAQMLRGGMDTAPCHLAEARAQLLDPQRRGEIDECLTAQRRHGALLEFQKFLDFALADKVLSKEAEINLLKLGRVLGLGAEDVARSINDDLARTGAMREVDEPEPPPSPDPSPAPVAALAKQPSNARGHRQSNPHEAYRRMLKLSGLDAESITLEHRDAFEDMAEQLGLDLRQAEDMVEEYLGTMSRDLAASNRLSSALASSRLAAPKISAFSAMSPARSTRLVTPREQLSPESERSRFPSFHNSIDAEMLLIPTGRFLMGSHSPEAPINEQPTTRVTLRRFYMSRHPITSGQYEVFDASHATGRNLKTGDTHPVVFVSHFDATRFCDWLSRREDKKYRLPTEAEWEYAARGTDGRIYPWAKTFKPNLLRAVSLVGKGSGSNVGGETAASQNELANFAASDAIFASRNSSTNASDIRTSPIGKYPNGISPFGVEDLSGNVWEWCQDFYATYRGAERMNPTGPTHGTHRVCRGGSWRTQLSSLKATTRGYNLPTYVSNDVGFRIVCECN